MGSVMDRERRLPERNGAETSPSSHGPLCCKQASVCLKVTCCRTTPVRVVPCALRSRVLVHRCVHAKKKERTIERGSVRAGGVHTVWILLLTRAKWLCIINNLSSGRKPALSPSFTATLALSLSLSHLFCPFLKSHSGTAEKEEEEAEGAGQSRRNCPD